MEAFKLVVIQGRAMEGGRKDVVEAGGGSTGEDWFEDPGVIALDSLLGGREEDLARDDCRGVMDLITLRRIVHDGNRPESLLSKVFRFWSKV